MQALLVEKRQLYATYRPLARAGARAEGGNDIFSRQIFFNGYYGAAWIFIAMQTWQIEKCRLFKYIFVTTSSIPMQTESSPCYPVSPKRPEMMKPPYGTTTYLAIHDAST